MKRESMLPTPADLTLVEIGKRFSTEETARLYLEEIRWPSGVICPHCKNADQTKFWDIKPNKGKKIRAGLRQCAEPKCKKQFTVTVGTIFEDSHIPLNKWLIAWYMLCSSKKGVSALQIQRMVKLGSYRSALFMMHRIRHALKHPSFAEKLPSSYKNAVEVDETYIGGKHQKMSEKFKNKTAVVALVERGGNVRSQVMERVTGENLKKLIKDNVSPFSYVNTDDHMGYRGLDRKYEHGVVKHSNKEYVRGDVHTNTVEGYFSLLKRGVVGTFHQVSKKHLHLYLAEFDHRYNHRKTTDGERTIAGLQMAEGKRLTLKPLKRGLKK